jgi:hypothetical protein
VHAFAVHHGHTGTIVSKAVIKVPVIVGEHEMQTIPDIVGADVPSYGRVGDKFKVDTIAVPADPVINDQHVFAFPAVDPIGGIDFIGSVSHEAVVGYGGVASVLAVDPEEAVLEEIIPDQYMLCIQYPQCSDIFIA